MKKRQQKIEMWPLNKLHDHPKQAEFFGDVSDEELEALAADMKAKGQRTPAEVLPDGTIITGHLRVRAAHILGWTEIAVVVRHDLEEAGPLAVEELFVSDNFVRRQLSRLARARCIKRILEIRAGDRSWGLRGGKLEELKTEIGKQLGLEVRSVNRYLLVLKTPTAVQAAFDREDLSLVLAGSVGILDERTQERIAKRIETGESAKVVVNEFLGSQRSSRPSVKTLLRRFLMQLKLAGQELGDCVSDIAASSDETLKVLTDGRNLVDGLLKQVRSNAKQRGKAGAGIKELSSQLRTRRRRRG